MIEEYEVLMKIWEDLKPHGLFRIPMICMLVDLVASDEGRDPAEVANRVRDAVVIVNSALGGI